MIESLASLVRPRILVLVLALHGVSLGVAGQVVPESPPREGAAEPQQPVSPSMESPQSEADEGKLVGLAQKLRRRREATPIKLSFAAAGASGSLPYGTKTCRTANSGAVTLTFAGGYSASGWAWWPPQPWNGHKQPICGLLPGADHKSGRTSLLKWGDMIYFLAEGFPRGEEVRFTIAGPGGSKVLRSRVEWLPDVSNFCRRQQLAARFSWAISPRLGAGNYTLTASGSTGSVSIPFEVHEAEEPNYGVQFGVGGHPLLLTANEKVRLVFAGFPANRTVEVLLLENQFAVTDISIVGLSEDTDQSQTVRSFGVRVNRKGWAVVDLDWWPRLEKGLFSFYVPDVGESGDTAYQGHGVTVEGAAYRTIQFLVRRDVQGGRYVLHHGLGSDGEVLLVMPLPLTTPRSYRVVGVEPSDTLNVRREPGAQSEIVRELDADAMYIELTDRREMAAGSPWFRIRCGEGHGWVNSRFLAPQD